MQGEALQQVVVYVDVASSHELEDDAKVRMRATLYRILDRAFGRAGIEPHRCIVEDRGDGALIAIHPSVSGARLAGLWLDTVYWTLHSRNRSLHTPLRLRVSMHVGAVEVDRRGLVGRAVDLTCRLCDSREGKALLVRSGAELVVIASAEFHESVVRRGGDMIESDAYTQGQVVVDGSVRTAWFHLPHRSAPRLSELEPPAPRPAPEPVSTSDRPGAPAAPPPAGTAGRDFFVVSGGNNTVHNHEPTQ
jgi:hypothetical protein